MLYKLNTTHILSLKGELSHWEISLLLLLSQGLSGSLLGAEATADGTGLLLAKIGWQVLCVGRLQVVSDLLSVGLVVDGQDTGDGLTHRLDLGKLGSSSSGHLSDAKLLS